MPENTAELEAEISRLGQEIERLNAARRRDQESARQQIGRLRELGDHLHRGGLEKARQLQQEAIQGLRLVGVE